MTTMTDDEWKTVSLDTLNYRIARLEKRLWIYGFMLAFAMLLHFCEGS